MQKHIRSLVIYIIALLPCTAATQTLVSPQFSSGYLKLINTLEFYSTKGNFDENGTKIALTDGNSFSNIVANFDGYYGLNDDWELVGGFRYSRVKSVTGDIERTQGNVSDIKAGAYYRFIDEVFSFYPGLLIGFPLTTYDFATNDDAIINEGASAIALPLYGDYKHPLVAIYSQITPTMMGDDRGWRLYYTLGAKKRIHSFIVNVELAGLSILKDDSFAESPRTRFDVVDNVNGGSLRYFSVNPGYLQGLIQARYRLNKMIILGLGYAKDLRGTRTSSGSSIYTYAEFRLPDSFTGSSHRGTRRTRVYTEDEDEDGEVIYRSNVDFSQNFVAESGDEDLHYFENSDPLRPQVKKKKSRKKKKRSRKKRRRIRQKQIQEINEDTFFEESDDANRL